MGFLPRKFAAVASALILAGCATWPEPEAAAEPEAHWRFADVYSIPAQAWIEQNHEAVGLAPVRIWVETYSNGVPKRPVVLRAHDKASGAWEQKVIAGSPMPGRMVFDLRPWLPPQVMIQ